MSKRTFNRIKHKLNYMGLSVNPRLFIYMRLASSFVLFIISFLTTNYGYIVAPLITIIYYFFVEYVILDLGIKRHTKEIENDALDFFPLFLIHLRGVRNVKKALYFTVDVINNDLSIEFKKVLNNVDVGKSLDESLKELQSYIPSEYVNNIITSIMEVNRVGVNIDEAINYQLSLLEEKKEKKLINKLSFIPVKIALISVIFVFMMLILLIFFNIYLV